MDQYLNLLEDVYENGIEADDRTGVGTRYLFGKQMKFDIDPGAFPIITTRKIYWEKILDELLWFLSGSTNVNDLPERTQNWWKPWADDEGNLGPIYGQQLREMEVPVGTGAAIKTIDQVNRVINNIQDNPHSRRHILTTWNAGKLDKMNLPPCHGLTIQFDVDDGKLDCAMYQRSMDIFIGGPANITSYSFLTAIIAEVCNLECGEFTHFIGNAHIYNNHTDQVEKQLSREPMRRPQLKIESNNTIDDYGSDSIDLVNYKHHDKISAPLNV